MNTSILRTATTAMLVAVIAHAAPIHAAGVDNMFLARLPQSARIEGGVVEGGRYDRQGGCRLSLYPQEAGLSYATDGKVQSTAPKLGTLPCAFTTRAYKGAPPVAVPKSYSGDDGFILTMELPTNDVVRTLFAQFVVP